MKNSMLRGLIFLSLLGISVLASAKSSAYKDTIQIHNNDLPVTFQSNVNYIVQENLDGNGVIPPLFIGTNVSNVVLDFNQHELVILDGQTGISLVESSSVTIKNGTITKNYSPLDVSTNAISLLGSTKITVEDMFLKNTYRGIFTDVSATGMVNSDIDVKRTTFSHLHGDGIRANAIQGVTVEDCTFLPAPSGTGVLLTNNYRHALIRRCNFTDVAFPCVAQSVESAPQVPFLYQSENLGIDQCQFSGGGFGHIFIFGGHNTHVTNCSFAQGDFDSLSIFAGGDFLTGPGPFYVRPCSGLLVDGCTFARSSSQNVFNSFIVLGNTDVNDGPMHDARISNSTFTASNQNGAHFDILAPHIQGLLVENCVLDSTGTCTPFVAQGIIPVQSANIHLGYPALSPIVPDSKGAHDVIIKDCVLTGKNQAGIVSTSANLNEQNTGITIEDCTITAQEVGVLFANTTSSNVTRCAIQEVHGSACTTCGIGILLEGTLFYNQIAESSANALIENVVSNNGCGVVIRTASEDNLLRGNSIFKNLFSQIDLSKSCNVLVDNVIFGKKGCCSCEPPLPHREPVAKAESRTALHQVIGSFLSK